MGFSAAVAERLDAKVYELHHVEESRVRGFQNRRSSRTGQVMGYTEEPFIDELR